jgi:signal transduction histidine kinase
MAESARTASSTRWPFISGIDLRNPLRLILMSGELAHRKGATPEVSEYLESIHASAGQMRRIIDTFLNVRRPGDETRGSVGRVDLNLMAAAVVAQNEPAGGRVTVRTRADDFRVRLEVQDNGPGVPAAERGALFTEFARLSNRPTGGRRKHRPRPLHRQAADRGRKGHGWRGFSRRWRRGVLVRAAGGRGQLNLAP